MVSQPGIGSGYDDLQDLVLEKKDRDYIIPNVSEKVLRYVGIVWRR